MVLIALIPDEAPVSRGKGAERLCFNLACHSEESKGPAECERLGSPMLCKMTESTGKTGLVSNYFLYELFQNIISDNEAIQRPVRV